MSQPNYTVSYDEKQGSIQFLYDVTDIFLRPIINGNLFPDGFLSQEKYPDFLSLYSLPNDILENYLDILDANKPFVASFGFGIVFAIIRSHSKVNDDVIVISRLCLASSCWLGSAAPAAVAPRRRRLEMTAECRESCCWSSSWSWLCAATSAVPGWWSAPHRWTEGGRRYSRSVAALSWLFSYINKF